MHAHTHTHTHTTKQEAPCTHTHAVNNGAQNTSRLLSEKEVNLIFSQLNINSQVAFENQLGVSKHTDGLLLLVQSWHLQQLLLHVELVYVLEVAFTLQR